MIVMLTCQYTEILGGAEKQCATLTQALRKAGEDVFVITSRVGRQTFPDDPPFVKRFWTYAPPNLAGRYLPASFIWAVQVLGWIARNRCRISVLHCHQMRIHAYVAALAHALFGIPTVMKPGVGGARNDFVVIGQRKYLFGKAGARFVARHTSAVIATSSQIAEDALAHGIPAERIHRIPNGVDLSQIKGAGNAARLEDYDTAAQFAFVGRLSAEKNILQIVDAFLSLKHGKKIVLNIIGDGPLKDTITEKCRRTPAHVSIMLHGERKDIFALLEKMHFLVLVSVWEGLSNALLEAASAGLVPVLSDVSGNRDVVDFPGYPLFVEQSDASGIAHALEAARRMEKPVWQEWSARLAASTRARYGIAAVAAQYPPLYKRLAGR